MNKESITSSSDCVDMQNVRSISDSDMHRTVVFVVDNRQHIDMFYPIHRYLYGFKILYINLACWGEQKCELENYLLSLSIPHITISRVFTKRRVKSLFARISPSIVILGHDTNLANCKIIRLAKLLNIPTLLIQDGIYVDSKTLRQMPKNTLIDKFAKIPSLLLDPHYNIIDKLEIFAAEIASMASQKQLVGRGEYSNTAVFGNATKRLLEREGVDPRKITVTGSPKFDYLYSQGSAEDNLSPQQLGILSNKKVVLLITQPFVESGIWTQKQREEYVSQVSMAVEKIKDCQLIIKIRRNRENSRDYKDLFKSSSIHPIICEDTDLYRLIGISEVVITVSSTGGLETIAAEKPLIIFDPFDTPGSSFYTSEGILFLSNINDLSSIVSKTISDSLFRKNIIHKQHTFFEENIFKNDGKAAERIYNKIIDIIKGN